MGIYSTIWGNILMEWWHWRVVVARNKVALIFVLCKVSLTYPMKVAEDVNLEILVSSMLMATYMMV